MRRRAAARAKPAGIGPRAAARVRWGVAAIFVVAAILVGTAAMIERRPARVTLTLAASEIAYTLAGRWVLHDVRAGDVRLWGMAPVRMDIASADLAQRDARSDQVARWVTMPVKGSVTVKPASGTDAIALRLSSDFVSIDLDVESQTRVRVASAESGRGARIEIIGGKASGAISVGSTIELQCDGCVAHVEGTPSAVALTDVARLELARRRIVAEPSGSAAVIAFEPPSGRAGDASIFEAAGIAVQRLEFHALRDGRFESTLVEDGKLIVAGSEGRPGTIRRGDLVRLECDGPADLRSLKVGQRVQVEVDCNASALRTGNEQAATSRLPSYLQWWYANETIALLGGAVMSLAAAILAVLKWLGLSSKA